MLNKGKDGKLVMMYLNHTNEIPLPNRNLGLYAVDSFVFNLQRVEEAPRRSVSARITRNPQPCYRGDDPAPEGPAYANYRGFKDLGPSQVRYPAHLGWDQPGPSQPEHARWEQPT